MTPFQQKTALWLLLSSGLAITIAKLTLMPQAPMPSGPPGVDKIYHAVAFAALVFPTAVLRPLHWRTSACLAIFFGGLIEVIQPIFGRSASVLDLVADAVGVAIGIVLGLAVRRILKRRIKVTI